MTKSVVIEDKFCDPTGRIGALVMLGFAALAAIRWQGTGLLFFALTVLRDLAAAYFLWNRDPDHSHQRFGWMDLAAYASSGLPLLYLSSEAASWSFWPDVLSILGFSLATLALFELGRAFGVSPAHRGHVRSGLYRFLSHPMYTGYLLSETGMCLLNPRNIPLLIISAGLYGMRAYIESRVLQNNNPSQRFI